MKDRTQRDWGNYQVNLIGTAQANADAGGLVILVIGLTLYALIAFYDWLKDVRYYRARKICRNRDGQR